MKNFSPPQAGKNKHIISFATSLILIFKMITKKQIAKYLVNISFIFNAIEAESDLKAFKEKPSREIFIKNIIAVFLILFSYVIGWPVIILLGVISVYFKKPLIVIIGGPVAYGISHLVFTAGMYLAGARYAMIFLRWFTRLALEKFIGRNHLLLAVNEKKHVNDKQIKS